MLNPQSKAWHISVCSCCLASSPEGPQWCQQGLPTNPQLCNCMFCFDIPQKTISWWVLERISLASQSSQNISSKINNSRFLCCQQKIRCLIKTSPADWEKEKQNLKNKRRCDQRTRHWLTTYLRVSSRNILKHPSIGGYLLHPKVVEWGTLFSCMYHMSSKYI